MRRARQVLKITAPVRPCPARRVRTSRTLRLSRRAVGPPPRRPAPGAELIAGGRRLLEELVGVGARSLGDAEAAEHPRHLLAAGLGGEGLDQRLRAPVALGLFDVEVGAGEGADVGQVRLLADRHALDAAGEPRGA